MSRPNTVTVWHAKEPAWRSEPPPVWNEQNYTLVAIIEPDTYGNQVDLDHAYEVTNHATKAWWDNEGVTRVGPEARSTSVGDVVFRDGEPWRVASLGFERVERAA